MIRLTRWAIPSTLLLVLVAAAAQGQNRKNQAVVPLPGPAGRPRAALLREQISQVFMQRAKNQLGLSEDQATRMQKVVGQWADSRLQLEATEHQLMMALHGQERPGVAGNGDSVTKLVEALAANRVADAISFQNELRDLKPILTPVQMGQFYLMQDQLMTKIRDLELQRQQGGPLGRGGLGTPPVGGGGGPGGN